MAVDIGPRIGLKGEDEYRKQILNITQAQKTLKSEMAATSTAFDKSASASDKAKAKYKALGTAVSNQKKKVEQLKKMTEESAKTKGEDSTATQKWKQALAEAEAELNRLNKELQDNNPLKAWGEDMQAAGAKISGVGTTMTKAITAPIMGVAAASVSAWKEVDEAMDIIVKKTGATGKELQDMQTRAKRIAKTIPTSFETAANAVGEVNTRFGVTGDELEALSTLFIEFAKINDTDVTSSVDNVQKLMASYGVGIEDVGKILDVMTYTGQKTGISMDDLANSMIKNSASLQEMGLDAYSAAQFLGMVETSGLDSATMMTGLKKALTEATEEGKTLPEVLSEFQTTMNSSATDQEKLNAAIELFGSKAGPAIYEACKKGTISFGDLSGSLTEPARLLGEMGFNAESTAKFLAEVAAAGADSETIMAGLKTALEQAGEQGKTLPQMLSEFESVMSSSATDQEKLNAAIALFGEQAGPAIYAACSQGSLSFQTLATDSATYMGQVQQTYEDTLDPIVQLTTTMNSLKDAGAEIGGTLLQIAAPAIEEIGKVAQSAGEWFSGLSEDEKKAVSYSALAVAAVGPLVTTVGKVVTGVGTIAEKLAGVGDKLRGVGEDAEGAEKGMGGLLSKIPITEVAFPLAALAVSGMAVALYNEKEKAIKATEAHGTFVESLKGLDEKISETQANIDTLNKSMTSGLEDANNKDSAISYWTEQMNSCFDASGQLKEGMEQTAEYAAGQLNTAMGTDFSTDFTDNFGRNQEILKTFNDEVETYLLNLKRTAVEQAFTQGYGESLTNQTNAMSELRQAQAMESEAAQRLNQAWKDYYDITHDMERASSAPLVWQDEVDAARESVIAYAKDYQLASETVQHAASTAASASASVSVRDEAMRMLAAAVTPEEQQAAIDLFASIGSAAQEAGAQAAEGAQQAQQAALEMAQAMQAEASENTSLLSKDSQIEISAKVNKTDVTTAANEAVQQAKTTIEGSEINGKVGEMEGAEESAEDAHETIEDTVGVPVSGRVGSVDGGLLAASRSWSNMQTWLSNNPLRAKIEIEETKITVDSDGNTHKIGQYAEGGIVGQEGLAWVAENNQPEAIIPLSVGKRARAMSLYNQVGSILGLNTAYVGGSSSTTNVSNMGGVSINVYGADGQDIEELADAIQDRINAQFHRKGATFA